jgi:NADH-quinone oxidoreductase subunit L
VLTAIYIFRAVFIVFLGPVRTEISGTYGTRIILPILILSAAALTIGWLQTPDFLGGTKMLSQMLAPATGATPEQASNLLIPLAGIAAPFIGIAIAYILYRRGFWHAQAARAPNPLTRLLRAAFGFDAAYNLLLVRPFLASVHALRHDPLDSLSTALEHLAITAHRRLRASQNGRLRRYTAWLMAGSVVTIAWLVFA